MRPILRSVSIEAKPRAEAPRLEAVAAPVPAPTAHLGQCWHCGVLNGQSAEVCWSCEASLRIVAAEPFAPRIAPVAHKPEESAPVAFATGNEATIPNARAPREARQPREARESHEAHEAPESHESHEARDPAVDRRDVPLLTIPVDMASEYPGPDPFRVASPAPRRGWQIPALIVGLLALIGGGGWLLMAGAARDAQQAAATSAAVLPPPLAQMPDVPAATVAAPADPLDTFGADTAPPPVAAPHALDPSAIVAAAPRSNRVRLPNATQAHRGKGRIAPPEPAESTRPVAPPPARQATPVGSCTPTVAALGLCASPSN